MTDLVKLYNPANASTLTAEQIAGLQKLTSTEIKELALAYPNMIMQKAYLLIIDSSKPDNIKQLPSLSTFENLWNLREKNGMKSWVAYQFKGNVQPKVTTQRNKRPEILDLSDVELMDLPGFKKNGLVPDVENITETELPEKVTVRKIKKVVAEKPVKAASKKTKSK